MYENLKKEVEERIKEGVTPNDTLMTEFSKEWGKIITKYLNNMTPLEALISSRIVLQSLGINPAILDNANNHEFE
jgi:hypothetical protein